MRSSIRSLCAVMLLVLLSACTGSTSGIVPAANSSKVDFTAYDTIVIENLKNNGHGVSGAAFSSRLAKRIQDEGIFKTVSREPIRGKALLLTGDVTGQDSGNKHLRAWVGFAAGQSIFRGNVHFKDAQSQKTLGTVSIDHHSASGGGLGSIGQDPNKLMDYAIDKIVSELKKAKGM